MDLKSFLAFIIEKIVYATSDAEGKERLKKKFGISQNIIKSWSSKILLFQWWEEMEISQIT